MWQGCHTSTLCYLSGILANAYPIMGKVIYFCQTMFLLKTSGIDTGNLSPPIRFLNSMQGGCVMWSQLWSMQMRVPLKKTWDNDRKHPASYRIWNIKGWCWLEFCWTKHYNTFSLHNHGFQTLWREKVRTTSLFGWTFSYWIEELLWEPHHSVCSRKASSIVFQLLGS